MICKLFLFCIIVMFSMISSDDFCQQFRNNYDRIGFTFRRDFKTYFSSFGSQNHIIINGKCWTFVFKSSIVRVNLQSKNCPVFSKEYNFGFCLNTDSSKTCNAFLFNRDTKRGVFIEIPNDKHEDYKVNEYKVKENITFSGLKEQQFVSVYPSDRTKTSGKLVFIRLEGRKLEGRLYSYHLETNAFQFIEGNHSLVSQDFPVLSGKQSIGSEEVMAMIYHSDPWYGLPNYGECSYFILLKNGLKVMGCWTSINQYNCTPKLIVDCSGFPAREEDKGNDSNVWLLVSLILIGIVVIILIIVISIFIIKNRNTGEQEAISMASATQTSRLSVKTGQPSTQSTARTFSQEFSLKKG